LYVSIAVSYNKYDGVPGPSGTFSRETVRMYKNPGNQNIFQTKLGGEKFWFGK